MQSFMYAVNFDDTEERKKKSSVRVKGRVNHCNFQTGKYACSRFREIWGEGNTFVYSGLFLLFHVDYCSQQTLGPG